MFAESNLESCVAEYATTGEGQGALIQLLCSAAYLMKRETAARESIVLTVKKAYMLGTALSD